MSPRVKIILRVFLKKCYGFILIQWIPYSALLIIFTSLPLDLWIYAWIYLGSFQAFFQSICQKVAQMTFLMLPYKRQNCWITFLKLLILEAYGEITQYRFYTSSPYQHNERVHWAFNQHCSPAATPGLRWLSFCSARWKQKIITYALKSELLQLLENRENKNVLTSFKKCTQLRKRKLRNVLVRC